MYEKENTKVIKHLQWDQTTAKLFQATDKGPELRKFVLIDSAHPYCARKFTRHVK